MKKICYAGIFISIFSIFSYAVTITQPSLPNQQGNAGLYLVTNGSYASWALVTANSVNSGISTANADARYLGITATANAALTANYAVTASYALNAGTGGISTANADARYLGITATANVALTANYAVTASYALNAGTGGISTANADARYLALSGGTLNGTLIATNVVSNFMGKTFFLNNPTRNDHIIWDGIQFTTGQPYQQQASLGNILYMRTLPSFVTSYNRMEVTPAVGIEVLYTITANSSGLTGNSLGFIGPTSGIGVSTIPSGVWSFETFAFIDSATGASNIVYEVYSRTVSGAETLLFTATDPTVINALTNTDFQFDSIQPSFLINPSDYLVVKYRLRTTSGSTRTLSIDVGDSSSSHVHTPLPMSHDSLAGILGTGTYHVSASEANVLTTLTGGNISINGTVTANRIYGIASTSNYAITAGYADNAGYALGMLTANIIGILNPIQGGTGTTSITALKNVLNLNLVENQALTTWEGSTSIRTLGVMTGISINGSISCNSGASFNGTVTANKFVGNGSGITGIVSDYATQSVSFVIGGQCFATSTAYGVSDNLGMAGGFYWYGGTVSVNAFTFRVRAVDTGATQPHVAINLNGSYIGETAISTSVQTVTLSTGNTLTNGNFFDMVLMSGGSNGNASTLVVTIWFKPKS